jgi:hypothetical protein
LSASNPLAALLGRLLAARRVEERTARREALRAMRAALRRELDRSRRYERRFVLIRAPLAIAATRRPLVESVRSVMRATDSFVVADSQLYLLFPEADPATAQRAFERIVAQVPGELQADAVALAAFPDHGLTLGALLAVLRRRDAPDAQPIGQAAQPPDVSSPTPAA